MKWLTLALVAAGALCGPAARAQSEGNAESITGAHELQLWLSDASVVPALTPSHPSADLLEIGGRYGWVLTGLHGPRLLRGQFEYAVEFIPVIVPFQSDITFGMGANPIVLKWNFPLRRGFLPYVASYGGAMMTAARVPPSGTYFNFDAGGGGGVQIFHGTRVWTVEFGFHHISDAHIIPSDPTYNALQLRIGLGIFRHRKYR